MPKVVGTKAKRKTSNPKVTDQKERRQAPARTQEAREKQLIMLSYDEAERVIKAGKATSQLLTHFLKLGSVSEELAREKIRNENLLLKAKAESIASEQRIEELYAKAIEAMRDYGGHSQQVYDEDDDD